MSVPVDSQCQRSARLALVALVFVCGSATSLVTGEARPRLPRAAAVARVFPTWDYDCPAGTRPYDVKAQAHPERGGFILPRDHVNVGWLRRGPHDGEEMILCKDVLVCAVEMYDDGPGCRGEPEPPRETGTTTLALTPSQAGLLTRASQYRTLELIRIPERPDE
jgi:hypothetical protein